MQNESDKYSVSNEKDNELVDQELNEDEAIDLVSKAPANDSKKEKNRINNEKLYDQFNFDYLSTEDLLGGLDEPFKKFIDEPLKGQVMLRADDGIHFTQAGLRLISTRLYELIKKQAKPTTPSP